jgi:hypothetical protein
MDTPTNLQPADAYRHQFWKVARRHLPNHALLRLTNRSAPRQVRQVLERYSQKHLTTDDLLAFDKPALDAYRTVAATAQLWHGTGRFQYDSGATVDIFKQIIEQGSLRPASDHYTTLLGGKEMMSISTTPLRIVARAYADMHGLGEREPHRYGSSMFWASYYYSFFYAELFLLHSFVIAKNYRAWNRSTATPSGERAWGKKVNQQASHVWDVFGSGSDIAGNYPILLGIAKYRGVAKLPPIMAKAEVRLTAPVTINDLSHLEVPASQVAVVSQLLRAHGFVTPVFPIELGERVAADHSIAELLDL